MDFGLFNEDTGSRVFGYPEVAVFLKNSETPLVLINFWEDEVLDSPDPDENTYFLDTQVLADDLGSKISATINKALKTQIEQVVNS